MIASEYFIIPIIIFIVFIASYIFREFLQPISDATDKPHVEYDENDKKKACVHVRWHVRYSDIPSYAVTKWKYYDKYNFEYKNGKWTSTD